MNGFDVGIEIVCKYEGRGCVGRVLRFVFDIAGGDGDSDGK